MNGCPIDLILIHNQLILIKKKRKKLKILYEIIEIKDYNVKYNE